jgi:hypothetical protein
MNTRLPPKTKLKSSIRNHLKRISQLCVTVMKYLAQATYEEKKVYFGSWFWRFGSKIGCPLVLGLWRGWFMMT